MLRQPSHFKHLFYKGISLKDYLRRSPVLIVPNDEYDTLLVDAFNRPLLDIDDLNFLGPCQPQKLQCNAKSMPTQVSTSRSTD